MRIFLVELRNYSLETFIRKTSKGEFITERSKEFSLSGNHFRSIKLLIYMFLGFRERCVSKATLESKLTAGVRARGIKKAAGSALAEQNTPAPSPPRVRDMNPYQIIIRNSHARALTRTQFVRGTRAYQERKRDIRGPVTYAG